MEIREATKEEIQEDKIKIIKFAMQNDYSYDDGGSYIAIKVPEYKEIK